MLDLALKEMVTAKDDQCRLWYIGYMPIKNTTTKAFVLVEVRGRPLRERAFFVPSPSVLLTVSVIHTTGVFINFWVDT